MKKPVFQKRIRLRDFPYAGFYKYFITIMCERKTPVFNDKKVTEEALYILKRVSEDYGLSIWVYCFMPEHLHLLLEGQKEDANLKKFISMFKQKTSYVYKKKTGKKLWQENYYEHILRKDEAIKDVARYILGNPVRRELVDSPSSFPFSGSFMFDIREL